MTAHKRTVEHRNLKNRQDLPVSDLPGTPGNGNGNGGNGNGGDNKPTPTPEPPSSQPPSSTPTSTPTSTRTSTTPTPTTTTQAPPPPKTTTSNTPTSTTPKETPTSTTTTTSSTGTSTTGTTSATSATSLAKANVVATTTPATRVSSQTTSIFRDVGTMSVDGIGATVSASTLPSESSGLGTGAIVGSVAGGLAGIAVLGFIIAFLLRRWRKKRLEDDDFGTDFRKSAFVQNSTRPSSMAEVPRGHTVAPSISNPGMAGQGAFSYGATDSSASAYSDHASSTTGIAAAAAASHSLQERPKYVYGQADPSQQQQHTGDDDGSEHAHGVYSSEPQMQQAYNAESYGSYAAYDNAAGYQDATRQYQGQEGYAQAGYAAQGYDAYGAHPYGHQYAAQGYDASQYAQYDPNQQYVVDPNQYAQYDQSAYVANGQEAAGAPHAGAHPTRNDDAYGGM